ncbi:hypothetical protein GA0070616_3179 [Micromonospora nigra]|uniref:Uncharacterized protein n=1 Tax=Micromonospora nigra TaxID=145857 RepID=A0A1C6S8N7_9ACTN|nr:hypothetical protein [Micromonospora nigra]SCL25808.1 hypothetical protein GA0070616_3179 [Micromonospora nigra]
MLKDQSMRMPDPLAAAARAELDDIQRRLDAAWDVEAGLRDVLLEERYHRFVDEQGTGFDVEAGLADVLNTGLGLLGKGSANLLHLTYRFHADADCVPVFDVEAESTLSRVRRLACDIEERLLEIEREVIDFVLPEDLFGHITDALDEATRTADDLSDLADELEQGAVTLEEALGVVRATSGALVELSSVLREALAGLKVLRMVSEDHYTVHQPPRPEPLLDLANEVNELQQPIRRLFDQADEVVGSLR